VARGLHADLKGIFSEETAHQYVTDTASRFRSARLSQFVPLMVYRFAGERLRAAAQMEGPVSRDNPEVLFVCVHNAGRSQMAAVLTHALSEGRVNVRSAGSTPADEINPVVVDAMRELGLDLSQEFPKPLTDDAVRDADVVVTMGCGDACPVYPGKRYLDWELDDPAGQGIEVVRRIRDDIKERVNGLLSDLGV
jgi:protein-tyrosine-phosphatase